MLSVAVLGPVELRRDGEPLQLPRGKTSELLARLALEAGSTVRSERLIEDLWGDEADSTAKNTLQSKVSQLRRALGDPSLVASGAAGYSLVVEPAAVDALEVIRLADLTATLLRAGESAEALRSGTAARAMYRGEVLADAGDADWLRPHRVRLQEVLEQLIEDVIAARLDLGAAAELIGELETLVDLHPLRERLRGQQMLALYRAGRQGEALRAYQIAREVLADELGLQPGPDLQRLEAAILAQDADLELDVRSRERVQVRRDIKTGNLPAAVSSFIGRSVEVQELCDHLHSRRLITLVGPGGAGKTRLALESAERSRAGFADGVWLIELAALRSGADVSTAAAAAVGLDDSDRLETYVAQRQILLVLDNCEHVIQEAASLAGRLLRAGSGVTVLATSRERLGVTGEVLYPVLSLAPDDATELFLERAVASGLGRMDQSESGTIEMICDQLDRLPLALELAAARTRSLSLNEIAERVGDRFDLLTGGDRTAQPRHQSLRGVVDWSYELLFTEDQRVFRQLSVFAGGFGLSAAQAVCVGGVPAGEIADVIGNLVDKSLVTISERNGEARYTLLQTLADYGRARLRAMDEENDARDRHLDWVVAFATEAEPALRSSAQQGWVESLSRERENIRTALEWAGEHGQADKALAIASGLVYGWYMKGSIKDSLPLLEAALELEGDSSNEHRAIGHAWAGRMAQLARGATAVAVGHAEQAVALARSASSRTFAVAAVIASLIRSFRGLTAEAGEVIDEALARLEDEHDAWGQAWADWAYAGLLVKHGDRHQATELTRRSIARFAEAGDQYGGAIAAISLGELAELRGDYGEAMSSTLLAYNSVMVTGANSFNASVRATRLGDLAAIQEDFEQAASWHEQGLSQARAGEFPAAIARAFSGMGEAARRRGELAAAASYHREALGRFEASESIEGASFSLSCLGLIATAEGDPVAATDLHKKGLVKAFSSSDRRGVAFAVEGIAEAHAACGDAHSAAALLGAAEALREATGGPAPTAQRGDLDRAEQRVRSLLATDVYAAEHARGRAEADAIVACLVSG